MDGSGCPWCAELAASGVDVLVLVVDIDEEDHRSGVWCPTCALPCAVAFPVHARCDHGWPQEVHLPDVVGCARCGAASVPRADALIVRRHT